MSHVCRLQLLRAKSPASTIYLASASPESWESEPAVRGPGTTNSSLLIHFYKAVAQVLPVSGWNYGRVKTRKKKKKRTVDGMEVKAGTSTSLPNTISITLTSIAIHV